MNAKETDNKTEQFRASLMKNMTEEEKVRFLYFMKIGDKIMAESQEVLKKLADS